MMDIWQLPDMNITFLLSVFLIHLVWLSQNNKFLSQFWLRWLILKLSIPIPILSKEAIIRGLSEQNHRQIVPKVNNKMIQNQTHLIKFHIPTTDLTAVFFADKSFSFSSTWISSGSMVLSESDSGKETRDWTSKPVLINSENEPCPMQQPCDKDKCQKYATPIDPTYQRLPIKNSFVSIKISLTNFVLELIIQKKFYSQTRLVGLI